MIRTTLLILMCASLGLAFLIYLERVCPSGEGVITSDGIACIKA